MIVLSFGGGFPSCCLAYGHGLGDLMYFFPLWFFTGIYAVLFLFFRIRISANILTPVVFGVVISFFVFSLIFNRGPECPCHLALF